MRAISLSLVLMMAAVGGCGRSGPGNTPTYRYEVKGPDGAFQTGDAGPFSLTVGPTVVTALNGRLKVNDKGYGPLKDGDEIKVDEGGRVTVNGEARSPE